MDENITWSVEQYTVSDLIINQDKFPLIIKAAEDGNTGYYGDGTEKSDPRPGQVR